MSKNELERINRLSKTGEEYDARMFLTTWRAMRPEDFEQRVDAMVAEIRALDLVAGWLGRTPTQPAGESNARVALGRHAAEQS